MEDWIKVSETKPKVNKKVYIMYSGNVILSSWDGEVWDIDPTGRITPMYWKPL